jgi:hypothetical protein
MISCYGLAHLSLRSWLGEALSCIEERTLNAVSAESVQAEDKEPSAVVAIGPESEWTFPGRTTSVGPSASVEFSVIKDWLEIEIGGGTLFRRTQTNGRPTFFSRSRSPFQVQPSTWWARDHHGATRTARRGRPARRSCSTSCFGRRQTESLDGSWSQPILTPSPVSMKDLWP